MAPPTTESAGSDKIFETLKSQIEAEVQARADQAIKDLTATLTKRAEEADKRAEEAEKRAKDAEIANKQLDKDNEVLISNLCTERSKMAKMTNLWAEKLNEKNEHDKATRAAINKAISTLKDIKEPMSMDSPPAKRVRFG